MPRARDDGQTRPSTVPVLAPSPDADLIGLADEIMAAHAETSRLSDESDAVPPRERKQIQEKIRAIVRGEWDLRARLAQMQATTGDGFRAKARVVQEFNNCDPGYADPYNDDAMAWSLANDLLGVPSIWKADGDGEDEA